jgi:hypothetical protein
LIESNEPLDRTDSNDVPLASDIRPIMADPGSRALLADGRRAQVPLAARSRK